MKGIYSEVTKLEILKAIILGIIEGITEFLPVSSTGHLIIAGDILNFEGSFAILFDVFIQLGAILAVIFYYRKRIQMSLKELKPSQPGFALWTKVLIAFLPSAFLGYLLKDFIQQKLFNTIIVSVALIFGAVLLLSVEKWHSKLKSNDIEEITYKHALLIGVAQCMALLPGMSRSAATIMGGLVVGLSLVAAAEFSFFLAIPTMLGAAVLSLLEGISNLLFLEWGMLAVGFSVSFVVALFVVKKFITFLSKHSLKPFAYYRFALGIFMLAYSLLPSK